MSARGWIIGAVAGTLGVCCGGGAVAAMATGWIAGSVADTVTNEVACTVGGATFVPVAQSAGKGVSGYDSPEQVADVATIVNVGQQMQVPARGWVIAVATAMQEARLFNPRRVTDHDSVGVFQQRPSQGWGTVEQIMDPAYASRKFYERLLQVPGWQSMALTVAAQAVQRSAFPSAYAKHEAKAAQLVDQVSGAPVVNAGTAADGCAHAGEVTASGWTAPVKGATVGEGLGAPRKGHRHAGVDLMVGKHTPIVSIADGVVIRNKCDDGTAAHGGCDRDGSPDIPGCGWYLDIRHAGGIVSRYCHQLVRPLVPVGAHVTAGQQVGWSGTSGNSSGPHVHFEIHTGGGEGSDSVIDPIAFMQSKGVSLGENV